MENRLARRRALLGLAAGIGMSSALRRANAQPSAPQGLHSAQGEVRINGAPAGPGVAVRAGDSVTAGNRALATFVVGQDAFLLRENSRIELAGSGLAVSTLRLVTGKLLAAFGAGGERRIVTATANIGIRGTGAYVEAEAERTYFCLCYGTAEVAAARSGTRETYSTQHHESPRYIYGDGRAAAIVPASVANHTDGELLMLEALVGRTPPEPFMGSPYMSNPYR